MTWTLEFMGQACTLLHAGPVRLLSDPWFSAPAHLSGWVPFPEWTPEEKAAWHRRVDEATHVYISHGHEDHFDPEFLATLAPKEILVGKFHNSRMRAALDALSSRHRVRRLSHGEPLDLADGVTLVAYLEEPSFRTNSMLSVRGTDGHFLNANDCGFNTDVLRTIARESRPTVFAYTLNFMANGFPFPYLRKGQPDLAARIAAVREQIVAGFRNAMQILRPKLGVAFAGPISFADEINAYLDEVPEARDWRRTVADVGGEVPIVWPAPGARLEMSRGAIAAVDAGEWNDLARPVRYHLRAGDDWRAGAQPDRDAVLVAAQAFARERAALAARLPSRPSTRLVFSAVPTFDALEGASFDWHIEVDLSTGEARLTSAPVPPMLQIVSTPRVIEGFLGRVADYDGLLVSGRTRFRRDPDTFDPVLHNLLRFGDDGESAEALVEWMTTAHARISTETITVSSKGREYVLPRYCPHEGEALDLAEIESGRIICPRHKWAFDLETGRCLVGDRSVNLYALLPTEKV